MNSVALIGRLTANPATHAGETFESDTFRLAVPRKGSDGADFVDIVMFDKLVATCGEYLIKGREVAVVGRLHLNEWTGREGERRSRLQVVADAVQFLDPPKKAADPDGAVADPADKPADRPAVGTYRRKASWTPAGGGHLIPMGWPPRQPTAERSRRHRTYSGVRRPSGDRP